MSEMRIELHNTIQIKLKSPARGNEGETKGHHVEECTQIQIYGR